MNYSTAKDMLILSIKCSSYTEIAEIIRKDCYSARLYEDQDCNSPSLEVVWDNTNRLLRDGWEGVKTGHTVSAGACLASVREGIYIIVLNSQSPDKRFDDTVLLYEWYCNEYRNSFRGLEE